MKGGHLHGDCGDGGDGDAGNGGCAAGNSWREGAPGCDGLLKSLHRENAEDSRRAVLA